MAPAASPATPARVELVDVVRGLALLGMLAVHFHLFSRPGGAWSAGAGNLVAIAAEGKFYPLFGCLFGVSFALQSERWGERPGFTAMYLRRLAALFLIAILIIGITGFDVLQMYAELGLVVLLMRRWSNRALLVVALVFTFALPVQRLVSYEWEVRTMPPQESNANALQLRQATQAQRTQELTLQEQQTRQYGLAGARALAQLRRTHMFAPITWVRFPGPAGNVLTLFLVGMYAVRRRVFQDPRGNHRFLWTVLIVGAFLGILAQVLPFLWPLPRLQLDNVRPRMQATVYRGLFTAVLNIGEGMWLGIAYAAGLILLILRFGFMRRAASLLGDVGRLSLTNYVMQAVMLVMVIEPGPLAVSRRGALSVWSLHIPITDAVALVATFAFFGLQILFSRWWIRRFRYGPLEWLWRSMTYARWQPIRMAPALLQPYDAGVLP